MIKRYKITFKQMLPEESEHDGYMDCTLDYWPGKTYVAMEHPMYKNWYKVWKKIDNNNPDGDWNVSKYWIKKFVELP
jgi:hypothetical protein